MRHLNDNDLQWVVKKIPKQVRFLLENREVYLAGGFIRSVITKEPVSDIDLFCSHEETASELANELADTLSTEHNGVKSFATDNAYSVNLNGLIVQFIHKWTFLSPIEIINHFDFTITQAVIWVSKTPTETLWNGICSDDYYPDLAAKRLVYTNPDKDSAVPGGSLLRVLKYKAKGYNPTLDSLAAIIARMARVEEKFILAELREVDPLSLVDLAPENKIDLV